MKVNMTAASQVEPVVERLGIEYMADELERSIDELLMEFDQRLEGNRKYQALVLAAGGDMARTK